MDPKQGQQGQGNDPKRQGQQADRPQGQNPGQEHRNPTQGNKPGYGGNTGQKSGQESEHQKGDRSK